MSLVAWKSSDCTYCGPRQIIFFLPWKHPCKLLFYLFIYIKAPREMGYCHEKIMWKRLEFFAFILNLEQFLSHYQFAVVFNFLRNGHR